MRKVRATNKTRLDRAEASAAGRRHMSIMPRWIAATKKGLHLDYETLEELEFPEFFSRYPEQARRLLDVYAMGEGENVSTYDQLKESDPERAAEVFAYACERHPIPPKDEPAGQIL